MHILPQLFQYRPPLESPARRLHSFQEGAGSLQQMGAGNSIWDLRMAQPGCIQIFLQFSYCLPAVNSARMAANAPVAYPPFT